MSEGRFKVMFFEEMFDEVFGLPGVEDGEPVFEACAGGVTF